MEYFIHSSTASYSKDLKKLVSEHGLAGLGFFWMAVEKLILSNMPIPLTDLVKRGFRGLSRTQATDIVINSGLFHYDENEMVSLAEKVPRASAWLRAWLSAWLRAWLRAWLQVIVN